MSRVKERRPSEHDALCAEILSLTSNLLQFLQHSFDNEWTVFERGGTFEEAWLGDKCFKRPGRWPYGNDTWPWIIWGTRDLSWKAEVTKQTVEAPLVVTESFYRRPPAPRTVGFVDVLVEGSIIYSREGSLVRVVEERGRLRRLSPSLEEFAVLPPPGEYVPWHVQEENFVCSRSETFTMIIEAKSRNEDFSAGDVIRQLKTYAQHFVQFREGQCLLFLVAQENLSAPAKDLLSHEGIFPFSLDELKNLGRA